MRDERCVFCVDVNASGEIVFENDAAWVIVHPDWSPRGHLMVVAKTHVENASALAEEEWLRIAAVWHRAEKAVLQATGAERAMILKLGIVTAHLHVHIYPVAATASREEVFAAFDGKLRASQDEALVTNLRARLTPAPR
jgi:diadenosine tetraphosphate (Ap4A) HIT family hydrolase